MISNVSQPSTYSDTRTILRTDANLLSGQVFGRREMRDGYALINRATGDIPAVDITSLTGTTPKIRRIYTRQLDATRGLICSHVIPVDATRAFTASDHAAVLADR